LSSAGESEAAADDYGKEIFTIPRPRVIVPGDMGAEEEASSEASSEASWEEHYERRVTTDSRRTETTRTVGGAAEGGYEAATTAEFRVYGPEERVVGTERTGGESRYRETQHETTERSMRETTEEGGDQYAYGATASGGTYGATGSGGTREPRSISAYSGSDTDYDSVESSENAGGAQYDKTTLVKRSRQYEPEPTGRGGTVRYGQEVTTRTESKEQRDL